MNLSGLAEEAVALLRPFASDPFASDWQPADWQPAPGDPSYNKLRRGPGVRGMG